MDCIFIPATLLAATAIFTPAACLYDGRPLSWDSTGLVPLDHDGSYTQEDRNCLSSMLKAEPGQAGMLARHVLERRDDLVCAWVVWQEARQRKTVDQQLAWVEDQIKKRPASQPLAIARCKLMETRLLFRELADPTHVSFGPSDLAPVARARERCVVSGDSLDALAAATESELFSGYERDRLLESYADRHKNDPAAKLLLVRAYIRSDSVNSPDVDSALKLLGSIKQEQPKCGVADFFTGRCFMKLRQIGKAVDEFKSALRDSRLPRPLADRLKEYLKTRSAATFRKRLLD